MVARPPVADTSVGRALRVVEVVAEIGDGVTTKSIARRLGLTLPTTYRLLATLVDEGYLVRLREPRGYGLGYRLGELARRLSDQLAMPWPVRGVLHDVHRAAEGAAYYAVFRDDLVVIAHVDDCPTHSAPAAMRVGQPVPAHAVAVGKVLLAGVDRRRLAELLVEPLRPLTGKTVVDRAGLVRELERVREAGVAVEMGELLPGRAGLAAPVRGNRGEVIGALGISVTGSDFALRRAGLERVVRDGAARAAHALAERSAAG
ncbi:MAG TPA: IclR family transcriptional regulator C-terminal domain-containing protein [Pseudonocardia sp.]|jgi:IclR family acetate operon transcriptional repressor|uniref:IclR family transcriptional regulator n=1 Tax=Pseudonocardia sp. TaxID=60912 RepID=UPI002EDA485E